jgi:hypothetical protein
MLALVFLAVFAALFRANSLVSIFLFIFSTLFLLYSSGRIGGVDTPFYRAVFGDNERCSIFEYGFRLLCTIDSPSGFSFSFLISSSLLLYAIYRSCENYRVLAFTFLILFPLYFVIIDLGYLRQSIATSVLLLFCLDQPSRKTRFIGYIMAPFFHVSSLFLVFFFELLYSKENFNRYILIVGLVLISTAFVFLGKFIDSGLIGLLSKEFTLLSVLNTIFLLTLTSIACFQYRWKFRVCFFVILICAAGYFGHLYRIYLFLVPIIAIGVAKYLLRINFTQRIISITALMLFGFIKLSATVSEFDGAFDIPYSYNSLFWFFDSGS